MLDAYVFYLASIRTGLLIICSLLGIVCIFGERQHPPSSYVFSPIIFALASIFALQLAYGLTFSPCHRSLFAFFALAVRLGEFLCLRAQGYRSVCTPAASGLRLDTSTMPILDPKDSVTCSRYQLVDAPSAIVMATRKTLLPLPLPLITPRPR